MTSLRRYPLLDAAGAIALLLLSRRTRGLGRIVLGLGATALAWRAVAAPARTALTGLGARRRRVYIEQSVVVPATIGEVFTFVRDFENFPRLLHLLESVTDYQDGRSHWVVRTPTGALLEWDAVVTKYVPNQVIAWNSVPGSSVESSGVVRLRHEGTGKTCVDLRFTYVPCETGFPDAMRALSRPTSSQRMREDLAAAGEAMREAAATQELATTEVVTA